MHPASIHPCIQLLQQGQTQALQTLFSLYHAPLVFFAQKLISDVQVAEDIVAEVFFKLWQKRKDFHSLPSTRSFLYISVRNACFNYRAHLRYRSKEQQNLLHLHADEEDIQHDEAALSQRLQDMWQAVNHLPPKCRTIMLLSFRDGLSSKEIARRLQLSVHTVRNQKIRGLHLIRQRLETNHYEKGKSCKRA